MHAVLLFSFCEAHKHTLWSCPKTGEAFMFLLDRMFIWFGTKYNQHIFGIHIGTNFALFIHVSVLFHWRKD